MGLLNCNIHGWIGAESVSDDIASYIRNKQMTPDELKIKTVELVIFIDDELIYTHIYYVSNKILIDHNIKSKYEIRTENDEGEIEFLELLVPVCGQCFKQYSHISEATNPS